MRRIILVSAAAIALVAAMIGVGWSVSPQRATVTAATRAVVHKVFFRHEGGYAICGITCESGGKTLTFTMPGRGDYRADITMTFQYRTSHLKSATAGIQVGKVRPKSLSGDKSVKVKPGRYRIAVAPRNTTTTVQYLVQLTGGNKYDILQLMLGKPKTAGNRWRIDGSKVVYSIDASPIS